MWRLYVAHIDGNITEGRTPTVIANWNACNTVYQSLSTEWKTIVRLRYQDEKTATETLSDYCAANAITPATVWKIVRYVQNRASEERGLIDRRHGKPQQQTFC